MNKKIKIMEYKQNVGAIKNKKLLYVKESLSDGSAYGIRTRDTALRGLWLNRLPNAPCA